MRFIFNNERREYDFYELEPFEVEEVLLDKKLFEGKDQTKYYGVRGRFIQ